MDRADAMEWLMNLSKETELGDYVVDEIGALLITCPHVGCAYCWNVEQNRLAGD
jgi:Rieske Fe-S protein